MNGPVSQPFFFFLLYPFTPLSFFTPEILRLCLCLSSYFSSFQDFMTAFSPSAGSAVVSHTPPVAWAALLKAE